MITGQRFPIEQTNLFKVAELEKKEIDKLKWIESEKEKRDIGIHRAKWIWYTNHRNKWVHSLRESGMFKDQH